MCFEIESGVNCREKIAEEDISCYKLLEYKDYIWKTPFMGFEICDGKFYKYVILEEERFTFTYKNGICDEIWVGLHSFSSIEEANRSFRTLIPRFEVAVFEAIIPKGTPYYYNSITNEYVSLKLIITPNKVS